MRYIYLAQPYTGTEAEMQFRFEEAQKATHILLSARCWVYSPIVHCHELAIKYDLPKDFDFWKEYNFAMLRSADTLLGLKLPGWKESRGMRAEIDFAEERAIDTYRIKPGQLAEFCRYYKTSTPLSVA